MKDNDTHIVSEVDLLKLWQLMITIRRVEEAIADRYPEGKMRCPTHLSIGQEGVAAAAGLALQATDLAVSTHRGHAHYLGKNGSIDAMIAELYGKVTGCSGGYGGSMHLIDKRVGFEGTTAIVGNSIPVGVGLAHGLKLEGRGDIACVFLGDAATEEGSFFESVNYALVQKIPVLFICENNLYSVYSPLKVRQPEGRKIHQMVAAMGMRTHAGDGNDVALTYKSILASAERVRESSCPEFLEFSTYRWREHCGPNYDNDIGYRSPEEAHHWQELDPIPRLKKLLMDMYAPKESTFLRFEHQLAERIDSAFRKAEAAPFPSHELIHHMVYA
jgi:TPP-dependent pyruvate/acetoin dehydrogenase alpha subunit